MIKNTSKLICLQNEFNMTNLPFLHWPYQKNPIWWHSFEIPWSLLSHEMFYIIWTFKSNFAMSYDTPGGRYIMLWLSSTHIYCVISVSRLTFLLGKIHFVWFYRDNQIRIFMVICKAGKDNADVQIAHHMERKMHRLHIIWRERCTDCTSYEDKEKIYWIMIINLYVFIYQGGIQLALVVLDLTKHENMFEFWNK